jgi:predicted phage terminase large subunit-like protein
MGNNGIMPSERQIVLQAARTKLKNFGWMINPIMDFQPFHRVYYEILTRFARGEIKRLIVQMPPQHGKAIKSDTPVLTTRGWKKHGELCVGDYVFGDDGKPKKVLGNTGIYEWRTMNVRFADGFSICCSHEHEWKIYSDHDNHKGRVGEIIEAQDIFKSKHRISPYIKADAVSKKKFFIESITECGTNLVNCIEVEGGMYLVGTQLVPTHNSQGSSRLLPAFMLGRNPDLQICIASYAATVARDFNRDVQRIVDSDAFREIFPDVRMNSYNVVTTTNYLRNSEVLEIVGHKGSLRVVGRGGSLTGKTVDVAILDDVYKDYAEGNSPIIREAAWKWYTTVVRTRLHNKSQEIIVFTRWHEDDIIGRLERSGETIVEACSWADLDNIPQGAWLRINFEALKESEPTELDQRAEGEALWEERHSRAKLEAQREIDPVQFQCLFQGNPSSAEGRLYQPFRTWVERDEWGKRIRSGCYIDVADEGKDYNVAVTYDIVKSDQSAYNEQTRRYEPILYALVTDIDMTDEGTEVSLVSVPAMINRNGVQKVWVESNGGGSQYEKSLRKKVRSMTTPFAQKGNKESRILTASAMVNTSVIMPFGWERRYPTAYEQVTRFLRNFRANAHDDLPDVLTGIYEKEIATGNLYPYDGGNMGVTIR